MPFVQTQSLEDRFWSKVSKSAGCWEWQASKNTDGYGCFKINYKIKQAHRVAYELSKGEIPEGAIILHSCDNPSCVNPDHLAPGTHQENTIDKFSKGRGWQQKTHCKHGHEYTPENTKVRGTERVCLPCRRASKKRIREAKKNLLTPAE